MVRARHCTDQTAKVETRRGGLPGLQAAREISDTHPLLPVDALKHVPHRLVSTWTRWSTQRHGRTYRCFSSTALTSCSTAAGAMTAGPTPAAAHARNFRKDSSPPLRGKAGGTRKRPDGPTPPRACFRSVPGSAGGSDKAGHRLCKGRTHLGGGPLHAGHRKGMVAALHPLQDG